MALAAKRKLTAKAAEDAVNAVFKAMGDALVSGERVELRGSYHWL